MASAADSATARNCCSDERSASSAASHSACDDSKEASVALIACASQTSSTSPRSGTLFERSSLVRMRARLVLIRKRGARTDRRSDLTMHLLRALVALAGLLRATEHQMDMLRQPSLVRRWLSKRHASNSART